MKRLMKAGAILFGLIFIAAGVIGIHQDNTFLPTKGVIRSMERTYVATDSNDTDTWEVMVEYAVDGRDYVSDVGSKKDDFTVGKEIDIEFEDEDGEDIVGFTLYDQNGRKIGEVTAFEDIPGNPCLEIVGGTLIPCPGECILDVDPIRRTIKLQIADGLI